jgi:hypothetical protein
VHLLVKCTLCTNTKVHGNEAAEKQCTGWFKYDRDDLCVNKSQFVTVIFEPPCINFDSDLVFQVVRFLQSVT